MRSVDRSGYGLARVTVRPALTPAQREQILDLADHAREVDGFAPLNEAAILALRHPRHDLQHLLATVPDGQTSWDQTGSAPTGSTPVIVGYAQLASSHTHSTGQLVVAIDHRRHGFGAALLKDLIALSPTRLSLWAMGDSPAARALASRFDLSESRVLLNMRRPLTQPVEVPRSPSGISVRTLDPDRSTDIASWLRLNARAFRDHPEQGAMREQDLRARMSESWFDPAGFFVAEESAQLVAFHWTKQHPGRLGEVYVLGVDPAYGGRGLGKLMLAVGLDHLQHTGNTVVQLYVESDHTAAIGIYARDGFHEVSRDVMYSEPVHTPSPPVS